MMYVLVIIISYGTAGRAANSTDFYNKDACDTAAIQIRKVAEFAECFPKGNPLDINADEIRKLLRPKS